MSDQEYKQDDNKLRFDLIDPYFEQDLAAVMTMGAEKYGADSWKQIPDLHSRCYAALRRHLTAFYIGEYFDDESGLQHLAHVAINAMFLHYNTRRIYGSKDVSRHGDTTHPVDTKLSSCSVTSVSDDDETEDGFHADLRILDEVLDRLRSYERPGAFDMYNTSDGSIKVVSGPDHSPQDHVSYIRKSTLSRLQRLSNCFVTRYYSQGNGDNDY